MWGGNHGENWLQRRPPCQCSYKRAPKWRTACKIRLLLRSSLFRMCTLYSKRLSHEYFTARVRRLPRQVIALLRSPFQKKAATCCHAHSSYLRRVVLKVSYMPNKYAENCLGGCRCEFVTCQVPALYVCTSINCKLHTTNPLYLLRKAFQKLQCITFEIEKQGEWSCLPVPSNMVQNQSAG